MASHVASDAIAAREAAALKALVHAQSAAGFTDSTSKGRSRDELILNAYGLDRAMANLPPASKAGASDGGDGGVSTAAAAAASTPASTASTATPAAAPAAAPPAAGTTEHGAASSTTPTRIAK